MHSSSCRDRGEWLGDAGLTLLRRLSNLGCFSNSVLVFACPGQYALMETAFSRVSTIELYDRIVAGLTEDNDIRALCNLMVSKLV